MPNYLYTNEPGTARRRAKKVIIENPSSDNWMPYITFVEEDRIIMADGTEKFIEVGQLTVHLDESVLAAKFPQFNIETGEKTEESSLGKDLLASVFQLIADAYITMASNRDINEQSTVVEKTVATEETTSDK